MRFLRIIVMAVSLVALIPGSPAALPRTQASGWGLWSGPGPGVPERQRGFVFAAAGAGVQVDPPCPAVFVCGSLGAFIIEAGDGTPQRGAVTCLDVTGAEAFIAVAFVHGDLIEVYGAYVRDRFPAAGTDRDLIGILPSGGAPCDDEELRMQLREAATPIFGDVTVTDACDFMVCAQRRSV